MLNGGIPSVPSSCELRAQGQWVGANNVPLVAMIPPAKPSHLENFFGQLLPAEGNWRMLAVKRGEHFDHESFESIEAMIELAPLVCTT